MVTNILKYFFEHNISLPMGFVNFSYFLPDELQKLYLQYYQIGSGIRVLFILLFLIIIQGLFAKKDTHRLIAKLSVGFFFLFWATDNTLHIMNTEVPLNIFGLPILKVAKPFFLFLFFGSGSLAYLLLRKQLGQLCNKRIVWYLDSSYVLLLLIYFLPLWSGELFQS